MCACSTSALIKISWEISEIIFLVHNVSMVLVRAKMLYFFKYFNVYNKTPAACSFINN